MNNITHQLKLQTCSQDTICIYKHEKKSTSRRSIELYSAWKPGPGVYKKKRKEIKKWTLSTVGPETSSRPSYYSIIFIFKQLAPLLSNNTMQHPGPANAALTLLCWRQFEKTLNKTLFFFFLKTAVQRRGWRADISSSFLKLISYLWIISLFLCLCLCPTDKMPKKTDYLDVKSTYVHSS